MAENSNNSKLRGPRALVGKIGLRNLLIGGGVLLTLALVGTFFLFSGPPETHAGDYQAALQAIDSGDFETARMLATEMYKAPHSYEKSGAPFYVLGAAAALEADESLDNRRRNELLMLAARYLEEARGRGFPPGREVDGALRLARSLFQSGQYAACLPILRNLLQSSSDPLPEAQRLLAGAYLRDSDPQYDQALGHIEQYLSTAELTPADRREGELEKVRILIALEQLAEADKLLGSIPPHDTDTDRLLIQGQLALAHSRQSSTPDSDQQREAIKLLQSAIDRDVTATIITPKAEYLLGIAQREAGNDSVAIRHFSRVRRLYEALPEGWSACLNEGELLLARGENQAALETLQQAAQGAGEAAYYSNPWIGLNEFRSRLNAAYSVWIDRGEFALANEFAKALPPIIPLAEAVLLRCEAHRLWAEALARHSAEALPIDREAISTAARKHHRTSAKLYAWLAELRFATTYYPRDIWNSGQQYLAGHDFEQASIMLRKYLEVELRQQRPEALTSLAKAQLNLGQLDEAFKATNAVLDTYPQHPETYRARLIASEIWIARRKIGADSELAYLNKARSLLEANLSEDALTPRSLEWRDSLFALGHVLSLQGTVHETASRQAGVDDRNDPETVKGGLQRLKQANTAFLEAIDRLEEATQRYPDTPQAIQARYELAEAYRNAAKFPRKKLPLVLIQTTRVQLQRQMEEQLAKAYEIYRELQDTLNQKQERGDLSEIEHSILRNCYFARADTLFDQGLYEEAIKEYSTASNRYQHEPAAMEAFVQIASCYRQLGRPYEARGILAQAKVVLSRIRDDAPFVTTTRFDRQQWVTLLDLLSAL